MDRAQIAHFNYVGDSIIGVHGHLGAGVVTSNYKLDGGIISVALSNTVNSSPDKSKNKTIKTNRNKLGCLLGHNT